MTHGASMQAMKLSNDKSGKYKTNDSLMIAFFPYWKKMTSF